MKGACTPMRPPDHVLEGPGPVTVEGRGGRREEPTDLLVVGLAETPTPGIARRRSTVLEDHPNSTEAVLTLAHRSFGIGVAGQEPHTR